MSDNKRTELLMQQTIRIAELTAVRDELLAVCKELHDHLGACPCAYPEEQWDRAVDAIAKHEGGE